MKTYFLLFACLFITINTLAQTTPIPDLNFEKYLEFHDANGNSVPLGDPNSMGDGIDSNGLVLISRVNTILILNISNQSIADVTGLEAFSLLTNLNCSFNDISTIDIVPVSNLQSLRCNDNLLTELDLSQNSNLIQLRCSDNNLNSLNVQNGNNTNFLSFDATGNIDLTCIIVDNPTYSNTNWTNIDPQSVFGTHCPLGETYVPDNNFENFLETHKANGAVVAVGNPNSMGNGIANDDYVTTSKIDTVTYLYMSNVGISDLTGIEAFISIENLEASDNTITSVNLSQNIALTELDLSINFLTNLDVSNNVNLQILYCQENGITNLDFSSNTNLVELTCQDNGLTSLNVKNGNNVNFTDFNALLNAPLTCIEVDNPIWSTTNWTQIDAMASFNHNCTNPETYVPDNNFETYLETHDASGTTVTVGDPTSMGNGIANDHYVTTANINTVTNLDVSNQNIADLTGIEDFVVITNLNCSINQLTNLDVSQNLALTILKCEINLLTAIDLTQNTTLITLYLGYNQLTNIDVTQNTNLMYFICQNNQLTSLNIIQNTSLISLLCGNNQISSLNTLQNTALQFLYCSGNLLTSLDTFNNITLKELDCTFNSLTSLDIIQNQILTTLRCDSNQLTSLNVKNGNNTNITNFNATNNPDLTCIEVDNVTYSTTNWTDIDLASSFSINCNYGETYVPDLNFENYLETHTANGTVVAVGDPTSMGNGITNDHYITTANINTVTTLVIVSQNITDLTGIEDFVTLQSLDCHYNQLVSLDLSSNTALINLICLSNQLSTLNVSTNTALTYLDCSFNQLSTLDVTTNTALTYLSCTSNQLSILDVSTNTALTYLSCYGNQLSTLDVSTNIALTKLICFSNQLITLDVSTNIALTHLNCFQNQLNTLDVATNTALTYLGCASNQLSTLDVTTNTALIYLFCFNNQLTNLNVKNGNNTNFTTFNATTNPNLTCIEVDNQTYSTANWTLIDPASSFSVHCPNLCLYPTNQTASTITTTGATLDWQENGTATTWDLEIGLQGFTPTGNPTNNDINKPYIWSNGLENTSYDFYVRADCNADNINTSSWTDPFSFSTLSKTVCENGFELVNGTPFTDISQGSIAFADIDSDNDQDVLISGIDSSNQLVTELYLNDGLGNFTLVVSTPFTPVAYGSITFADIDNDNDQDVLITGITSTTTYQPITELYTNDGLGNFTLVNATPFENVRYSSAAFIDIDNDNDLDVLISGQTQANQRISKIYTNNGSGVFTFNTNLNGLSHSYIIIGDIDNDNDSDIFITGTNGGQTQNYLYKNDGLGNFTASPTSIMPVFNGKAIFADIDNDNDLDLFVAGSNVIYSNTINFYLNDGLGNYTLTPTAPFDGFDPANGGIYADTFEILDIDNDNDMDVALVNNNSKQLYENDGFGNYTLLVETPFVNTSYGSSMISFDMDNDSDQDILITGFTPASTPISNLYKNNINYDTKYTVTGWTNGVPTLSKCAVIDQDYTTTSFSAYKTTVNTNKTLTIVANTYVQVQKSIENNGLITIEPTGSLVQIDDTATVTGTGVFNTKIETTPLQDATRVTYFSSPSANETLNVFSSWGDMSYLWEFNETNQSWEHITNTTPMQAANGYIMRGDISNIYPNYMGLSNFQNAYNNGVITQNLHFKGDGSPTANLSNDSNLVGNPYPSAISGTKLLNSILNPTAGTLYFWTHNSSAVGGSFSTDDYAMWNLSGGTTAVSGGTIPTGYIASGQGFFIDAEGDETLPLGQEVISTLTFNNEMRETLNNTDFRTLNNMEFNKIWLNLSNNQGVFNQTLLSFLPNATTAHDTAYDGKRSANGVATFYSVGLNNQHYGIQALPLLQDDTSIPLGYQIENKDITNLNISIDHFENLEDVIVYLRDNLLNITHNLSQQNYDFMVSDTGIFNTRFELLFKNYALSEDDIVLNENLIVNNQNDESVLVKTNNGSIIKNIKVYDVLGKLILNSKHHNATVNLQTPNINQGTVLFLKVTLENGQILNKKIIKL